MADFKDLLLFFLCMSGNVIYFSYGFFFSYHVGYVKHFHEYSIATIFSTVFLMDFGLMFANAIFPRMFRAIGINNCFRMYGVACSLAMAVYSLFTHFVWLCAGSLLVGFSTQLIILSVNYCLSAKYYSRLVRYTGYVFTGTSVANVLCGLATALVINPENRPRTMKSLLPNGQTEAYFDYSVTVHTPRFFALYAAYNALFSFMTAALFELGDKGFSPKNEQLLLDAISAKPQSLLRASIISTRGLGNLSINFVRETKCNIS